MWRVATVGLLLLALPGLFAAERSVSYEQVASILNSALASLQSDAQIARRLAALEPGEPISDLQKEALLSRAPGPRTRDVLQILVDASAFVDRRPRVLQTPPLSTCNRRSWGAPGTIPPGISAHCPISFARVLHAASTTSRT